MDSAHPVVLLAEDDAALRRLIAAHLTRLGMKVVEVGDGRELADYLARCSEGAAAHPDVVVSDIDMPHESGPQVLARAPWLAAPVVLISAATPQSADAVKKVGAVAILDKPFQLRALVATIRAHAANREVAPTATAAACDT